MSELYSLPNGWEWKKLGKIAKLQNGFAFKSKLFVNDGLPIVRIKNIKNEKVLLDDVVYFNVEDYGKKLDSYQIKKNDILIAMSGATTGKIGLYDTEEISYLNQRVGLFRIENSNLRSYLFYFLSTQIEKNLELSLGAAQPNLSTEQINNIELPFPPFEEQKRIVAKLDILFAKIDKAIALHQKNCEEADIFMASVLNDVFEELEDKYGLYELNKVCEFSQGIQVATNQQYESYEDGLNKFIRIINYTQLSNEYRYVKAYSERAFVNENDIVMVRYGATAGFIGRGQKGLIANNLFRVIPNKDYINDFIYFGIKNPKNQSIMFNNIGAAAMPAINFGTMSLLTIPNISISIQQKVVAYLDEISNKMEKIKQIQKEKMQSLKALKASILDQAFKGEL